jgi:hypothetical protein
VVELLVEVVCEGECGMNAHIFCLRSQKKIAEEIEALLKQHIFEEMRVLRHEISDDYCRNPGEHDHEHCRLFLKLFKASMIRVDDFAILVADGRGRWYYMGGTYQDEPYLIELFQQSMTSVFPAVAVMNRMVIMPHDIGSAFEKSRVFPWFVKPRDLEGAILTNFRHRDSLAEGIRQIGVRIRSDIAKLCKRHMLMRKIKNPDFTDLGFLLDVNPRYLELHRSDVVAPAADLTAKLLSGPVHIGKTSKVLLEINYESEDPLPLVFVKVNAPSETLKSPVEAMMTFSDSNTAPKSIEFEVTAKTRPYCPLEVLFGLDDEYRSSASFPFPIVLEVQ